MHLFPREFLVGDHYLNRSLDRWLEITSLTHDETTTLVTHTDPSLSQVRLCRETQYIVKPRGGRI